MKKTWIVVGSLVAVVTIGWSTTQAVGLLAHEELTETSTFPAADLTTLSVRNTNGSIEIDGDPTADGISIVAEISNGLQATRRSAKVVGDTLELRSSCPFFSTWCSVDYRITVPARLLVEASSDNGRITVRDVDGDVDLDSDNGRIEVVRLAGGIVADSDNGRFIGTGLRSSRVDVDSDNGRIELSFASAPEAVTTSSNNGRIEIVVPDGQDTYAVTARSDNGSSDVGIRTDPASARTIHADADNGSIAIRYPAG